MTDTLVAPADEIGPPPPGLPGGARGRGKGGDHFFRWLALLGSLTVLVVLGLIAYSTTKEALPWFRHEGLSAILSDNWDPAKNHFGALALIYGSFLVGTLALVLAVPVSIGI